ncbi:hypothetical protein [uncultured Thiodictyon sp.]|uniref:hypothetical protein n=1 Tax=uncultured Thiodictyon sp. TaxID=1846217 RepID=UPI0026014A81|nr:hypothetical protein [uncultured Thiodictyon sp.]
MDDHGSVTTKVSPAQRRANKKQDETRPAGWTIRPPADLREWLETQRKPGEGNATLVLRLLRQLEAGEKI